MGGITLINLSTVLIFFKELKLATFDAALAASLGLAPALIHYGLMTLVSITTVGAFDAVGLILVVALMVGPAAAAYLLTDRLGLLLLFSVLLGMLSAALGFGMAILLDASIAGSMAVGVGLVFTTVFLLAPGRGLLAEVNRRRRQRLEFAELMLAIHLMQHEGEAEEEIESRVDHLHGKHVGWTPEFTERIVQGARQRKLVEQQGERLFLTETGRTAAGKALSGTIA
jgi:manganese/zinc/iron transport system permease protein